MTKIHFFLHGGRTSLPVQKNKEGLQRIYTAASHETTNVEILCIYFSRTPETWAEKFQKDITHMTKVIPEASFRLAEINSFQEQIKAAHVLYFAGGSTELLKETLQNISLQASELHEKIVFGSSAGACVFSDSYLTSENEVKNGLGMLPFHIVCHYEEARKKFLKQFDQNHPILCLPDTEMVEVHL